MNRQLIRADTPIPEVPIHPATRAVLTIGHGWRRVFADSPLAPLLSHPSPIRRSGFDLDVMVRELRAEAEDVVSLTLVPVGGGLLPSYRPGSHLDLFLPSGRQRHYSLCGDPRDRSRYRIAVRLIRDGGGGSREIHEQLTAGAALRIRGPRNAFRMVNAPSYLFLAGGIGITPILPMVKDAARRGLPWRLVYCGRTRASMPFLAELKTCRGGTLDVRPDDECGHPEMSGVIASAHPRDAVYVCGPPPMIEAAHLAMRSLPNPARSLYSERFSPPSVLAGKPFTVELRRTGVKVEVGAEESVLAAVRRAVPGVPYSCQQGYCGSCRATVLAGEVEHRDTILDDAERDSSMLICVSRATGRLALDL